MRITDNKARAHQTAIHLAEQWRGTDPMTSEDDVRRAVLATGEVATEDVGAVVEGLCPMLRAQGTLTCIGRQQR